MHPQPQIARRISHFTIKGSLTPVTLFEVLSDNIASMDQQLKASMARAPLLLKNAPTVIDLSRLPELSRLDIADLVQMLKLRGLSPVGFRSTQPQWKHRAEQCGLVEFPVRKAQVTNLATETTDASISRIQPKITPRPKVINQPVRSGQRIVAADSDLIIMNSVGAGAEVLAAGNIHIYGTLRGRALAGIHGNDQCQIFCQQLEAELLAIAGQYKVCDDIEPECWQAQTHIYLNEGRLILQPL